MLPAAISAAFFHAAFMPPCTLIPLMLEAIIRDADAFLRYADFRHADADAALRHIFLRAADA